MLQSERLILRAPEPTDVDTLYQWENDSTVWEAGITLAPYSRKQLWEYIDSYEADIFKTNQLRLMITLRGSEETVGTVDLFDFDPANARCGIGILVIPAFQRQGIATETLLLVEQYCRNRIGMHQLYCTVGKDNTASRTLFHKCGYAISGRLRSWLKCGSSYMDAYLFQKLLP